MREWDMMSLVPDWLPFAIFAGGIGLLLFAVRRQQKQYSAHLAEVTKINEENRTLNRNNHKLAVDCLIVLKEIKTLLETRKP